MKRIISAALIVCLMCLGLGAVSVCAEDSAMTRLEAVMFIEECVSPEIDESFAELNPFADAPEGAEACLGFAYENYIVKGVGDNLFVPEREVTREEFLLMALRLIGGSTSAWCCNAYVSAFVSAYVAGIYDYTEDIDARFTTSEAETIMARVFALERCSYPNAEPNEKIARMAEEEKAGLSEYRKTLSSLYTNYYAVDYFNELSEKAVLFRLLVGTPHGSTASCYVINKSDGTYERNSHLPETYWITLVPDEIWVSDDEKTLYYTAVYENQPLILEERPHLDSDEIRAIIQEGGEIPYPKETKFSGTYTCEVDLDTMEAVEAYIEAE